MNEIMMSNESEIAAILFIAAVINSLFVVFGFYKFPYATDGKEESLSGWLVIKAFILFLMSPLILIPSAASLWFLIGFGKIPGQLPPYLETWLHLASVGLSFVLVILFLFLIDSSVRKTIFGFSGLSFRNIFMGAAAWFAAYPTVEFVGKLLAFAVYELLGGHSVDQIAVEKVKSSAHYPAQHQAMMFSIIAIVPLLEELLFRGFLQTWLRQHFGRLPAIFGTSWIFALFHFSKTQGLTNITLIGSLFVLSCYLGFLRERQGSIWASIALHSFFNGVSLWILLIIN